MNSTTLCIRNCLPDRDLDTSSATTLQQRLQRWYINWRTRRQLLQLDRQQLSDIGVSLAEAVAEADKPFWRD
jgi:uncharacterized protein YjiS (DUF1127 family)